MIKYTFCRLFADYRFLSIATTFVSAILFIASILSIKFFWWVSIFFLVPILNLLSHVSVAQAFMCGCVWAGATYVIQFYPVICFISDHITHPIGLIVPAIVLLFCMIGSGVWFVGLRYAISLRDAWLQFICSVAATITFFAWIHKGLFFPLLGRWYGYPFSLPILPLFDACLSVQWLVATIGIPLTLVFYVMIAVIAGLCVKRKRTLPFLFLGLIIVFLGLDALANRGSLVSDNSGSLIAPCTFLQNITDSSGLPYERMVAICDAVEQVQRVHADAFLLVLPESIFPYSDQKLHENLACRLADHCHPDTYVLLGTYRKEVINGVEKRYNCGLLVNNRCIIQYYDKKLLIPFFEYVPPLWSDILFSINGVDFVSGTESKNQIVSRIRVTVKICAEAFWDFQKDDGVVIALVNDSYFKGTYLSRLMCLWVQCQARASGKKVIYSGWE